MAKRWFDVFFSIAVLLLLSWLIFLCWLLATLDMRSNGMFVQKRIGQFGNIFRIYKLRSIHPKTYKITRFGRFIRKYKLDELPQFYNVLIGDMSVVGPRPDVEGYYDQLVGEQRKILELRPGITSEASIKYSNEDAILEQEANPLGYNDTVIFPDKVKMNLHYYYHHTFLGDLLIIMKTIVNKS